MKMKVFKSGKGVYDTDEGLMVLVEDGVLQDQYTGEIYEIESVVRDSKENVLEIIVK